MFKFVFGALLLFMLSPAAFAVDVPDRLYAYETAPGMSVGAVFGSLPDVGKDDVIVSVSAESICDHVEIHQMIEESDIMKMRKIDSLPVHGQVSHILSPRGYHLMLMKLAQPLKRGMEFPLTLHFKEAGDKIVEVPVISRQAP